MKHQHHIVPKSRGGGNEPWNFHEKDAYDHAYDHALDFVLFENAPVFDCRHEAWPLLPEDLKQLVREKLSLKMKELVKNQKGKNHPQYGIRGEQSPNFGRKHTLASRQKMSLALRGKPKSEEHRQKIIENLKARGPVSDETKAKISKSSRGVPKSEEHKEKISETLKGNQRWLGRKHSEETRRRMSEAAKNRRKKND